MMKVGVEQQAVGAFMYQVIAGVTAITSLVYPYLARSADRAAGLLERASPSLLRRSVTSVSAAFQGFRTGLTFDNEFARRIRGAAIPVGINLLVIVVLISTGGFVAGFAPGIADAFNVPKGIVGTVIGLAALTLCVPAVVALWRSLRNFADELSSYLMLRHRFFRTWVQESLRRVIRDSLFLLLVFLVGLGSLPLISELLSLGSLGAPVPLVVLAVLAVVAVKTLTDLHRQLLAAFSQTFLGAPGHASTSGGQGTTASTPAQSSPLPGGGAAEDAPQAAAAASPAEAPEAVAYASRFRLALQRAWGRPQARRVMFIAVVCGLLVALALGWALGYWLTSGAEWWFLAD